MLRPFDAAGPPTRHLARLESVSDDVATILGPAGKHYPVTLADIAC